jgi:localization factor PodJL
MTANAPWSVKGIDPKAREVAKDLARRSGMTLGEWLNHVILEDDGAAEEPVLAPVYADRQAQVWAEAPLRASLAPEGDRQVAALDRLTHRLETTEARTSLAVSGVEQLARQALSRIEATEREQQGVANRVDGATALLAVIHERVQRLDAGPRSPEALRMLEQRLDGLEAGPRNPEMVIATVQALAARLAEAEARTDEAIAELRQSMGALDSRISTTDVVGQAMTEQRLEVLAEQLDRRISDLRAEFAAKLEAATGARLEARFAEINGHIQTLERRSAQAIDRMGKEVMHIADAVNNRILGSEERSAEAIERVGGEIARIAGAVEGRLERAEGAQADALGKLGAEIAKITERLSERLVTSEQRSAQAIDEIGQQVTQVAERIEQRHDQSASELAERLLESEARTTKFLAEARAQLAVDASPAPADLAPLPTGERDDDPLTSSLFVKAFIETAETASAELDDDVFELSTSPLDAMADARASAILEQPPTPPFEARTKVDPTAVSGAMFSGFGTARTQKRPVSTLQTALLVVGGATFLGLGAAGVTMMDQTRVQPDSYATTVSEPRAAVALAADVAPATTRMAPADDTAFLSASQALENGKAGAVDRLRVLADRGNAAAQLTLGQLYESGRAGVKQDMVEARRLTALAADAGNSSAMYNLGLYMFRGEGGEQDMAGAAQWFRKAAVEGVVDSQYNLGLMYQTGSGVKKDLAEAYKWFSLAAAQGDGLAAENAVKLGAHLPTATLRQADAAVAAAKRGGA